MSKATQLVHGRLRISTPEPTPSTAICRGLSCIKIKSRFFAVVCRALFDWSPLVPSHLSLLFTPAAATLAFLRHIDVVPVSGSLPRLCPLLECSSLTTFRHLLQGSERPSVSLNLTVRAFAEPMVGKVRAGKLEENSRS